MKYMCLLVLLFLISCVSDHKEPVYVDKYNVLWDSPSEDPSGQMPIGNGDIAAGVYAIENGDLYLLLSKNDAFTYNGDLFKTGRVRLSFKPNPFVEGASFSQELDLKTGAVNLSVRGVKIKVWADANSPVYHVEVASDKDIKVVAQPEFWDRIDGSMWNLTSKPIDTPTQDVCLARDNHILWYYAVGDRSVYDTELRYYDVEDMASSFPDPYRYNTFGNLLESDDLLLVNDKTLEGTGTSFDIRIHAKCEQNTSVETWVEEFEHQASRSCVCAEAWIAHCEWWSQFWARSWIVLSDNTVACDDREKLSSEGYREHRDDVDGGALVAQSYNVFRYLMACQSRGAIQTKFNGGLFTQPLRFDSLVSVDQARSFLSYQSDTKCLTHEDSRDWGRRFTFQNQRLLYWPLLMSGDNDLMKPFFAYYHKLLPIRKAITKAWFGHDGAYFRENIEPTGGERDCGKKGTQEDKPRKTAPGDNHGQGYYHSYYFTCGLETVTMMLEQAKYSEDDDFKRDVLTPFAREILTFFDLHYQRDAQGKIKLDPAMVLETFFIAVNPSSDIAGLQFCLDELLALGVGTIEDVTNWKRMRSELPAIPLHTIDGKTAIAPAESWAKFKNAENGELYPVFPFRCFGVGQGSQDIVQWTMKHRTNPNKLGFKCWSQDEVHWAYAGRAKEAKEGLEKRFRHASTQCRFPLYGSRSPDSCPDFDHFGVGSTALQRMLVQEADGKILLLPAWPKAWDVDFKLHLEGNTIITGVVEDGNLVTWDISPASRKANVVVCQAQ